MTAPPALADDAARRRALTERDASLWVEAGAGSGKTALMAGRVVLLLADGVAPDRIAAITFTELAAAELHDRIHRMAHELLDGKVPVELAVALPGGLSDPRRARLAEGVARLDDLTATTIHGFAFDLIRPYPVAADLDPGAAPMDPAETELTYRDVVDAWLRDRLEEAPQVGAGDASAEGGTDDVVAALALEHGGDAPKAIDWLLELAQASDERPDVTPPPVQHGAVTRAFRRLDDAVRSFAAAARSLGGEPPGKAATTDAALAALAASWRDLADRPLRLAARVALDRDGPAFTGGKTLYASAASKKDYAGAASSTGLSKHEGEAAHARCADAYDVVKEAFAELETVAADLLHAEALIAVADLRDRYQQRKRASARLDFGDLLRSAVRLLRDRPDIRDAAAERYRHVLVDEFQDTDPRQAEIVWRITGVPQRAADGRELDWRDGPVRGCARFVVGDPKQSIYRFRQADVRTYLDLRGRHEAAGRPVLQVATNFRSRPGILDATNAAFEAPLDGDGQPGYQTLVPHRGDGDHPAVARLRLPAPEGLEPGKAPNAGVARDVEALAVARLCARLIHGDPDLRNRSVPPADIALLAPVGSDLWRYERALEDHGVAVASQAGKGFFGRQEVQDLVALARVLADPYDTHALGALLRGPLVGATDEALLDVAEALRDENDRGPVRLTLRTDPERVPHDGVRRVLRRLAPLQRQALARTPYQTLSAAIDRLEVRALVRRRQRGRAARALANVERFLDAARPWAARGLEAFARDAYRRWKDGERALEGRPDAEENAVTLITVHSAKGLEWKVVIPINTLGKPRGAQPPYVDRNDGRVLHKIGAATPSGFEELDALETAELEAENLRLLYVAATRAADLLVVPRPDWPADEKAWLALAGLHELDGATLDLGPTEPLAAERHEAPAQDRATFAAQAERIDEATPRIVWTSPSRHDAGEHDAGEEAPERQRGAEPVFDDATMDDGAVPLGHVDPGASAVGQPDERPTAPVEGRGRVRGLVLHALMESLITGEVAPDAVAPDTVAPDTLEAYARQATDALLSTWDRTDHEADTDKPDPAEMATTARRAWEAPELADLRDDLVAEVDVYGRADDAPDAAYLKGVADAVAVDASGHPYLVIDWKSDVEPSEATVEAYRAQVTDYLRVTGVAEGWIVYLSTGRHEQVLP